MDRLPRVSPFVLASVLAIVGTLAVGPAPKAIASPAATGDFSGLVDIGGRSLYLECRGQGSPTVILESGAGGRADIWSRDLQEPAGTRTIVLPGVAAFTRVCAYDRPGTLTERNPSLDPDGPLFFPSRCDPVPQPRTTQAGSTTCARCSVPLLSLVPTSWSATPRAAWWCGSMQASTRTRWSAWCCWTRPTRMCGCVSRRP